MKQVLKYALSEHFDSEIKAPPGRVVLFGFQASNAFVWIEVESFLHLRVRHFRVVATGESVPETFTHLHSIQHGDYVWHLYELPEVTHGA
jgi:hypothetical protein